MLPDIPCHSTETADTGLTHTPYKSSTSDYQNGFAGGYESQQLQTKPLPEKDYRGFGITDVSSDDLNSTLLALVEAARGQRHDETCDRISVLLRSGGLGIDALAALLMDSRSRISFLAVSDLSCDEDVMDTVTEVTDDNDSEALEFIQNEFTNEFSDREEAQEVRMRVQSHQALVPEQEESQLDTWPQLDEDLSGYAASSAYAMSSSDVPYPNDADPFEGRSGDSGSKTLCAHQCLGPCRWHNKPQGCKWAEKCSYCHICPHKRPNKTTRKCQRLGISKKQLVEYLETGRLPPNATPIYQ